ncbi:hypothetical protein TWF106_011666 [Orbilia oligospora]|uniref:DUF1682-domain-containing protein n=1 Tax=Orbilia oligospora TaxID=2813651 RepID=A0A6G1LVW2_ORBOL|nr:hypothetical protein TWF788_002024 [Orbilia oligospora]KAF3196402.1 hypothetical protein TWF679_005219 [Orbilia oligospora]KAF3207647.1 hypothetical protein TWF106_011666 [Orbilia oligospora]KAF3213953.1 hypothetical protein TWF191_009949 [Orbilia oligospora]KAF3234801.1 hypothetical protein TWF192_001181 [Orbilia oligospora]
MGLFGGKDESSSASAISSDTDFADFAASTVESIVNAATSVVASAATGGSDAPPTSLPVRPSIFGDEHPWYAFWLRVSPKDFITEYFIIGFLTLMVTWHFIGVSVNRKIAKKWVLKNVPLLQREYARVGFQRTLTTTEEAKEDVAAGKFVGNEKDMIREESSQEFVHYTSGRMNVLSTVFNIKLKGRGNPFLWCFEVVTSFFMDSFAAPSDTVTITTYTSDGADASKTGGHNSKYDGFVWGVVNKKAMATHRNARYDLSLTKTVDTPKLPAWLTVMTESAEITDTMLTKDLIAAIEKIGDGFQYLAVTDQPIDKPTSTSEFDKVKKRIVLHLNIESNEDTSALMEYFLRLPDFLVSNAHFRPEVTKKVRSTRDEERRKLEKAEDDKKAEERQAAKDEKKKAERDAKLRGLSADEQKKFLDKEKEKEMKKAAKKQVRRV